MCLDTFRVDGVGLPYRSERYGLLSPEARRGPKRRGANKQHSVGEDAGGARGAGFCGSLFGGWAEIVALLEKKRGGAIDRVVSAML